MIINPAHNKSTLIFLLSSIGLITFPHIFHLPGAIFGFFCLLLTWRFIGIWKPYTIPSGLTLLLLTVLGIALLFSQQKGILGRDAGTGLFMVALSLKLMEIKNERDLYLVNYLAFIVAASQFLYEESILMAAYILVVCCVLMATLIFINSHHAKVGESLKKAAIIVAQAIPMAIAVFILFPRVEAPRWLLFNTDQKPKMGLSDSMEPGSISDLGQSDELVFRVKFVGSPPPPHLRYWRGPVLSHTDGKRWTQGNAVSNTAPERPTFSGTPYQYTLLMEPQVKNWVFALDMPAEFPHPLSQNSNYQLLAPEALHQRIEYPITSYLNYNTGIISLNENEQARQLPAPPSYRIKQLVTQLQGFSSTPDAFIQQLLNHFRRENFHYTLTPPIMEDNPIESFLFEKRRGFCSHYASAFVYLMRAANIPARVVTGYQGGEFNAVGGFLEIKQAQAHAWAEVWLDKQGWVRVDPTAAIAPERIEKNLDISQLMPDGTIHYQATNEQTQAALDWLKQAGQLWGDVDYNWQRWVINYSHNQANLLSSLGIQDFKDTTLWMIVIIGTLAVLLGYLLLYQKPQALDRSLIAYNSFLRKLAKIGLVKRPTEGARDFAERIKIRLPEHADSIDHITNAFIEQRYGSNPTITRLKQLDKWVASFKV